MEALKVSYIWNELIIILRLFFVLFFAFKIFIERGLSFCRSVLFLSVTDFQVLVATSLHFSYIFF